MPLDLARAERCLRQPLLAARDAPADALNLVPDGLKAGGGLADDPAEAHQNGQLQGGDDLRKGGRLRREDNETTDKEVHVEDIDLRRHGRLISCPCDGCCRDDCRHDELLASQRHA